MTVDVTAIRPFGADVVHSIAPDGVPIRSLLFSDGIVPDNLPFSLTVCCDGNPVSMDYVPAAGSLVTVYAAPRGGVGTVFRVIATIGIMALGGWIAGPAVFGLSGLTAGLVGGGIGAAGLLALNALIPPRVPDVREENNNPTLWISGAKNSFNRWGAVPVILGEHRTVPFYASRPYTEIVGNDQYWVASYVIGYGPLELSDFKFGETSLYDLPDCELEIRQGTDTDEALTIVSRTVTEASEQIALTQAGGWQQRTTAADIDEVSVDVAFLQGLVEYNDDGSREYVTVQLEGEYSSTGLGSWTAFGGTGATEVLGRTFNIPSSARRGGMFGFQQWASKDYVCINPNDNSLTMLYQDRTPNAGEISVPGGYVALARVNVYGNSITSIDDLGAAGITGLVVTDIDDLTISITDGTISGRTLFTFTYKTNQPIRRGIRVKMPSTGQYDIRLRRTTADSTDDQVIDECHWLTLRSISNDYPIEFPEPLALVAVRIRATDSMSGSLEEFNCVAKSIVNDYDMSVSPAAWTEQVSENPASLYRHVLQGPMNPVPVADASLDLDWFEEFAEWCETNEYQFSAVYASAKSVLDVCADVLAAARTTWQITEGKYRGVTDKPQTTVLGHYTPHNSWNLEITGQYPDLPHAWRVSFIDRESDYKQAERVVYSDGYGPDYSPEVAATKFESVEQLGVTNYEQIYKLWRYNYACAKLRWSPITFNVDWEHLANTRGDLVRVSYYELLGAVTTGRIKAVVGDTITVDNACRMAPGTDYGVRIRLSDGSTLTGQLEAVLSTDDYYDLTFDSTPAQTPEEGDLFQFGELSSESLACIIKDIEQTNKLCARVTCLEYAADVFTADTEEIPDWTPVFNQPLLLEPSAPDIPVINNISSDITNALSLGGEDFSIRLSVNFTAQSTGNVQAEFVRAQYYIDLGISPEVAVPTWETTAWVPASAGVIFINDAANGEIYEVRIQAQSRFGLVSEWSSSTEHEVDVTVLGENFITQQGIGILSEDYSSGSQRELQWELEQTNNNDPAYPTNGERGGKVLHMTGYYSDWTRLDRKYPFDPDVLYRFTCRFRRTATPDTGDADFGFSLYTYDEDEVATSPTYIDLVSDDLENYTLNEWQHQTIWFKGTGTGGSGTSDDPYLLPTGTKYFIYLQWLQWSASPNTNEAEVDFVEIWRTGVNDDGTAADGTVVRGSADLSALIEQRYDNYERDGTLSEDWEDGDTVYSDEWTDYGGAGTVSILTSGGARGNNVLQVSGGYRNIKTNRYFPFDPETLYRGTLKVKATSLPDDSNPYTQCIAYMLCYDSSLSYLGTTYFDSAYLTGLLNTWVTLQGFVRGTGTGGTGTATDPRKALAGTVYVVPMMQLLLNDSHSNVCITDFYDIEKFDYQHYLDTEAAQDAADAAQSDVDDLGADVSRKNWSQTCTFSSASATQVNWASGTLRIGDTNYSISANNTGTMSARTYIYFNPTASTTEYQKTSTLGTAIATGNLLIAYAINGANEAFYKVLDGSGMNIDAVNELYANTLSAISANLGTITAGTVTGATVQTDAAASTGVKMTSSGLYLYDSSNNLVLTLDANAADPLVLAEGAVIVDRGDPSAYDFDETDMSVSGSWTDLSLASIVPDGYHIALLNFKGTIYDDTGHPYIAFRRNGLSNNVNTIWHYFHGETGVTINCHVQFLVFMDSSRIVEYQRSSNWTGFDVMVQAYFK